MDPYDEQRLRDEVIYLHSLWHQGPPRSTSTNSSNDLLHQLPNRTQFMRDRPKPRAQGENGGSVNRTNGNQEEESQDSDKEGLCNPASDNVGPTSGWPTVTAQTNSEPVWQSVESGKEWTCTPSSDTPAPTSGWPTVTAQQNLLSHEQQARFAGNQAHFKALKATKEFFRSNYSDDDDEIGDDDDDDELGDDNESDEDEDHDDLAEEEYGGEEYRFFVKVFEEDSELREYYEKNYHNGYFSCLVCSTVGIRKACKRFRDCVALIQHSVSVAKTKKRRAHRAYGKAICKVLGWDIHKLPTIVSALSANLGVSLSNSGISEGEALGHVGDETKDNPNVLGSTEASVDIIGNSDELQEKEPSGIETLPCNDESMISKKSLAATETSKCDEDPNLTAPKIVEDKESVPPSDGDAVAENEGKNAVPDVLAKNDIAN